VIDAVLFDLDNTLTDRRKSISVYSERFLTDFPTVANIWGGAELAGKIAHADNGGYVPHGSLHDSVYIAIASYLMEQIGEIGGFTQEDLENHWRHIFPECSVEMLGATSLLSMFAKNGIVIGIVSNGAQSTRLKTVASLPFGNMVDFVLSSESAGIKKPAAGIFEMAAETANTRPEKCCFVGDHPTNDVIGASSLGMKSIWLTGFHAWPATLTSHTAKADTLAEVGDILKGYIISDN